MQHLILVATVLAIAILGTGTDFIIANTTVCYGAFPMDSCKTGVQVISQGVDFSTSLSCNGLCDSYIKKNSAGPSASDFTSTGNMCDRGRLYFERNYTKSTVNGTFDIYQGLDASGYSLGQCEYMEAKIDESKRRCSQWLGTIFYVASYICNTTICGDDSLTSSSISSTLSATLASNATSEARSSSAIDGVSSTLTSSLAVSITTSSTLAGSSTDSASAISISSLGSLTTTSLLTESASSSVSTAAPQEATTAAAKRGVRERKWNG
ncbi:hypothetical protein Slin15195_G064570 [Septoria linicola]|uniref:Uncharacterized protein n=1 Tax=Septoria linicola TaxID=215465 RepID=A0A9Q9ATY3_9PEZI|nr:hypothetical protein Slin14017_G114910 [Septoria linicola]USW53138.1 hypothetical protein Slin15195_G064570 [Septoria linicola]